PALTGAGEQVRGAAHRLLPTGHDDIGLVELDRPRSVDDGAQAAQAHLVDGVRRDVPRDAGTPCCLPRRVLPGTRLNHLAHDDLVDEVRGDACTLEGPGDRPCAQLGSAQAREATVEPAHRRPCEGQQDDLSLVHGSTISLISPLTSSGTADVAARTSATLTPGARSRSTRPADVTSITARSVITRSTTPRPVSGRVHSGSSLAEPSLATCSIRTTIRCAPWTRSIAPPIPLTMAP